MLGRKIDKPLGISFERRIDKSLVFGSTVALRSDINSDSLVSGRLLEEIQVK